MSEVPMERCDCNLEEKTCGGEEAKECAEEKACVTEEKTEALED